MTSERRPARMKDRVQDERNIPHRHENLKFLRCRIRSFNSEMCVYNFFKMFTSHQDLLILKKCFS